MQPAIQSPMPDVSPAVFAVNGEKPHQGVASKNPGLHRAFFVVNSTTALGVSWGQWSGTAPGARVTYEYDAFGNALVTTGSTPNEMLYRGEQYDSDLSLYYLRARYYDPSTGRFMSRDPLDGQLADPASLHKYLYANGDPADLIDPAGRAPMLETGELEERTLPELEEGAFRLGKLLLKYNQCAAFVIADAAWIVTGNWASAATGTLLFFTCLAQAGG
jgi:RHS repeat-associated protein